MGKLEKLSNIFLVFLPTLLISFVSEADVARFKHIDVNAGLPDNSIRVIEQDNLGFMWVGTDLGLTRYDGYQLINYVAQYDAPNSLPESFVRSITVTNNNEIWVGTEGGLAKYNENSDNFTIFQHDETNSNSLSSNYISDTVYTKKNSLWIATNRGINRFNLTTKKFTHYFHDPLNENSIPNNNIITLFSAANGKIWFGGTNGLSFWDPESQLIHRLALNDGKQPTVRTISQNSQGTIWVGTLNGLFELDPNTKLVKKTKLPKRDTWILSSIVDSEDNLWVGTYDHGLYRLSSEGDFRNFSIDKSMAYSLSDNAILSLYQDQSGIIWIGTRYAGINYFDPKSLSFGAHNNSKNSIYCASNMDVRASYFVSEKEVLLGTLSGLLKVNLQSKQCESYIHDPNVESSISHNEIYSIEKGLGSNLWLGTANGFDLFNLQKKTFRRYGNLIGNSGVHKLLNSQEFLIVGSDRGLYKFDRESEQVTLLDENNPYSKKKVNFMTTHHDGRIFVASKIGLLEISPDLTTVQRVKQDNSQLYGNSRAVAIDAKGRIYFTIDGKGLFVLEDSEKTILNLGKELDLPISEGFVSLYIDKLDQIWLATANKGLFMIDQSRKLIRTFGVDDGLHAELFNYNSFAESPDNKVLWGGGNGFNLFNPKTTKINLAPPTVSLIQLKRFGKIVQPFIDYDGLSIEKHISKLETLKLSYKDSIIGFDFIATHYLSPERLTYSYKLEGFDPGWVNTNAQNRGVTYNNLSPGEYTFRVKAKTKNGVWSENEVSLKIIVTPAPWNTWWAYLIYILVSVLSIVIYVKRRTRTLEERAQLLENTVEQRTQELSKEKQKVEQLLSKKNEEFANVSHEFRTPLTLVLGPAAQLIEKANDEASINKLNIIQRNGYRLLRMVDQLLNIETFRIKTITKKSPQAIGKNTKLMCEAFSDLADANRMKLSFAGEENINFEFTQDAYEKILLNLLSNAIKYSKPGAEITVETFRTKNNEYHLSVKDTGIGIPADKIDSVFERYNRVMDENSEQVTGAGIGLALVKELVEAHQGRIQLKSELGKGTSIDIYLPIMNEVSDQEVASLSNEELIDLELVSLSNQKIADDGSVNLELESSRLESTVLVIEDNPDMRQYITNSLQDQYKVLTANNGKAGVELAIAEVPDVIVSDIMMPVMDGYEATKAIRDNEITSHIPLVLLTARGDRESRLRGWNEKADEYLTKPFDVEELRIRLANLLEIRNLLKKKFAETIFVEDTALETPKEVEDQTDIYANKQKQQQIFIDKLNSFLNDHYSDTELAIPQISKGILMSERQFFRKLKSILDLSPVEYLRRYRLQKGKELLGQGLSTNRTAFDVGFSSQGYFGRCFKAQYGVSPSEYKKQLQSKA